MSWVTVWLSYTKHVTCKLECMLLSCNHRLFNLIFRAIKQGNQFYFIVHVFNWSIVDLQCCVSFKCSAKQFSCLYMYMSISQVLCPYSLLQNIEYHSLCYIVFSGYLFYI